MLDPGASLSTALATVELMLMPFLRHTTTRLLLILVYPMGTPMGTPMDTPMDTPVGTPMGNPMGTPMDTPVTSPTEMVNTTTPKERW